MKEVSEEEMLDAIQFGHNAIKLQCKAQLELRELCGNKTKREYSHETNDEALLANVKSATYDKVYEIARAGKSKSERSEAFTKILEDFIATLPEEERDEASYKD